MKTSQKILITGSGIITALLITSMVVIRDDIQAVFAKRNLDSLYKTLPVEKFARLDFSSANWNANIRQGIEYKLELAVEDSTALRPIIRNVDGTLYFSIDTIQAKGNTGIIKVKISTPLLTAIKSVSGTRIHLRDFQLDSLAVDIQDGCVFTGTDNKLKKVSIKSSGDAWIELRETPDF